MNCVPDFFQDDSDEALRSRVDWLEQHLGLGDVFFARLLRADQDVFSQWRRSCAALAGDKEAIVRHWWDTVLHLLSFQGFDEDRLRRFLKQTAPEGPGAAPSVFSPPWSASSLKEYLERHGPDAIREVDRWLESFRFGDPYAPPREEAPCP
jgi:hypothetical protein